MAQPKDITQDTFTEEVIQATKPTVVDYWADWCQPCKMLSPVIDQLAQDYGDKINFVKINADANSGLAMSQGIMALPTVQFYRDGQLVQQFQGAKSKSAIAQLLDELI